MAQIPARPGHLRQHRALMPALPARPEAALFRSDRCGGGLPNPSLDGGRDESRGLCLSRASSSPIRSRACANSSTTSPAQPAPHPRNQHHRQPHRDATTTEDHAPATEGQTGFGRCALVCGICAEIADLRRGGSRPSQDNSLSWIQDPSPTPFRFLNSIIAGGRRGFRDQTLSWHCQ